VLYSHLQLFWAHAGVFDAPELLAAEAFVAQAVVEALAEGVLPGLAGVDVVGVGACVGERLGELEGDELRPIVEHPWPAMPSEEPRQDALDDRRGKRAAWHQGGGPPV
jgi:hypothetical protein